eukprot:COSAG02_NODE_8127_length_2697_cov_1.858353_1_plen_118_part_00
MRQFADSLYCKLTPYSITSALITQGTEAYVQAAAATSWTHMQMRKKHSPLDRIAHRVHGRTLHIRQVKPCHVAASNQKSVYSLYRGLHIPLIYTRKRQESGHSQWRYALSTTFQDMM